MKASLRAGASWACVGWGLLVAGAGVGHSIASWRTALSERGALDARFALMMAVGWVLLCSGAALAHGGWRLRRGGAPLAATVAAAFLLVLFLILWHAAGPVGVGGTSLLLAALLGMGRTQRVPA